MAETVSRDPNGNRTIQFVAADGKRRSIRLGKLPQKAAEAIKAKVVALNACVIAGVSWDRETAAWVGGLGAALHDETCDGRITPRVSLATTQPLRHSSTTTSVNEKHLKPSTRAHLKRAKSDLVGYFGGSRPLSAITEGDADEFRLSLSPRLADNTIRRICGRARQFFSRGSQTPPHHREPLWVNEGSIR